LAPQNQLTGGHRESLPGTLGVTSLVTTVLATQQSFDFYPNWEHIFPEQTLVE
jgi:hypothetical protein